MELNIIKPETWETLTVMYTIHSTDYTLSPTDDKYILPQDLENALKNSEDVYMTFRDTSNSNNVKVIKLIYDSSYNNTIDIQDLIDNSTFNVTIGDYESEKVFISKTNLLNFWDKIKTSVKSNFYNKTEIDSQFNNTYKKAETYSATQINSLLGNKANTNAVYSKLEVDALLQSADTYTKSEIDSMLEGLENTFNSENYYTKDEINSLLNDIENGSY